MSELPELWRSRPALASKAEVGGTVDRLPVERSALCAGRPFPHRSRPGDGQWPAPTAGRIRRRRGGDHDDSDLSDHHCRRIYHHHDDGGRVHDHGPVSSRAADVDQDDPNHRPQGAGPDNPRLRSTGSATGNLDCPGHDEHRQGHHHDGSRGDHDDDARLPRRGTRGGGPVRVRPGHDGREPGPAITLAAPAPVRERAGCGRRLRGASGTGGRGPAAWPDPAPAGSRR